MSYEKLRVYQAAQEWRAEVDKLSERPNPGFEDLFRHVDEAVDSVSNYIAEGGESIYPGKQRLYYDHAAGSVKEVRSGLRSLDRRGAFDGASVFRAVGLTLTIAKMLKALINALPHE